MTINTSIDINSPDPLLQFTRGEAKEKGSRAEFLHFNQLKEILEVNDVLGENGSLTQEKDGLKSDLNSGIGNRNNREEKMESLVYDTLAKYIIQMLNASKGIILFNKLIPLENHKEVYFKTNQ
ncbi:MULTISPECIES: hypothetical protein [unclassified Flavobacterium]|uniref:hypothetical protein n=1 Tax=unclassified Flavobacterium TaxID=196869 RepID=UPI000B084669|nr:MULTISPECIES: hypothetical protein [unclassified Flavobacterium]